MNDVQSFGLICQTLAWGAGLGLYSWRSRKVDAAPGIFFTLKRRDAPGLYWTLSLASLAGSLLCLGFAASLIFAVAVHQGP